MTEDKEKKVLEAMKKAARHDNWPKEFTQRLQEQQGKVLGLCESVRIKL